MESDSFHAVAAKIARVLGTKTSYFVTHPAELYVLKSLTHDQLVNFAAERGWRVVRRVGGRQIEFYNDVSVRRAE